MQKVLTVVCLASMLLIASSVEAQNPDYVLSFTDATGGIGDQVQVSNIIDLTAFGLAGWSWSVCNNINPGIVDIVDDSVEVGVDAAQVNDGDGPDFFAPGYLPGEGWTLGVVVNLLGNDFLSAGVGLELHTALYDCLTDGVATLQYCTLGNPPVETVLVDDQQATIDPTLTDGTITVTAGPVHALFASDAADVAGSSVTVFVTLDNPDPVEGFSFGIADDGVVAGLQSIDPGAVVAATNGGAGPDFFGVNTAPAGGSGGTVGCAITIGANPDFIPVGMGQEIALLGYTIDAGAMVNDSTPLEFTDTLGNPNVSIVVTVGGLSVSPTTNDGSIMVLDGPPPEIFRRGDTNNDGVVDISDGVYLAGALFMTGPPLTCDDAGDTNDDGVLDALDDTLYLLNYLFLAGQVIPAPFPNCGTDPTMGDSLDCASAPACP